MEEKKIEDLLFNSVSKIFGEMAFIDVEKTDIRADCLKNGKIDEYINNYSIYSIDLSEPFSGTIFMIIPEELKKNVANNIFGDNIEADKNQDKSTDCLLEILTIITGDFFNSYITNGHKFVIDLPKISANLDPVYKENSHSFTLDAEGQLFQVGYILK